MEPPRNCRIPMEAMLDYIDERADDNTRREIRTHLDRNCSRCTQQFAELQRLLPTMREAGRYQAPTSLIERAKAIYRERFRKPARVSLIARLLSDSRTEVATAGARGAERTGIRMAYETDEHDIDLWQEREAGGAWYLIGQAVVRTSGDALVPDSATLTSPAGNSITGMVETDEFHLADVPAGTYNLELAVGDVQIVLANVPVGEAQ